MEGPKGGPNGGARRGPKGSQKGGPPFVYTPPSCALFSTSAKAQEGEITVTY